MLWNSDYYPAHNLHLEAWEFPAELQNEARHLYVKIMG